MSGAVLGMRRAEINRKFDEIVEFAGVEQFLDTPVKRYSSGMQVRLGFAVAAHLEPEILFVDEVLAVGDAEFQKKCLGKMSEIGAGGADHRLRLAQHARHPPSVPSGLSSMKAASSLSVLAPRLVGAYLESDLGRTDKRIWESEQAPGENVARSRSVRVIPVGGGSAEEMDIRAPLDIEVEYFTADPDNLRPTVNINLHNEEGVCLLVNCDWNNREWWSTPRFRELSGPGVVSRATSWRKVGTSSMQL